MRENLNDCLSALVSLRDLNGPTDQRQNQIIEIITMSMIEVCNSTEVKNVVPAMQESPLNQAILALKDSFLNTRASVETNGDIVVSTVSHLKNLSKEIVPNSKDVTDFLSELLDSLNQIK